MSIRKNTRRFDPRYFMDEKTEIIKEEISAVADLVDTPVSEQEFTGFTKEETIAAIRLRLIAEHGSDPIFKKAEELGLVDEMAKAIYHVNENFADQEGGDILSQKELKHFLDMAMKNRAYRENPEFFNEDVDVEISGGGVRSVKGTKDAIIRNLEDAMGAAQEDDFTTVASKVAFLHKAIEALKDVGEAR